jgi:hypothetical protein
MHKTIEQNCMNVLYLSISDCEACLQLNIRATLLSLQDKGTNNTKYQTPDPKREISHLQIALNLTCHFLKTFNISKTKKCFN